MHVLLAHEDWQISADLCISKESRTFVSSPKSLGQTFRNIETKDLWTVESMKIDVDYKFQMGSEALY